VPRASESYQVVRVVYRVLYHTPAEKLAFMRVQAQHHIFLACLNAMNLDVKHVPSSGFYNFESLVASANIALEPLDYAHLKYGDLPGSGEDAHVRYAQLSEQFRWATQGGEVDPLTFYRQAFLTEHPTQSADDVTALNVWIAPLGASPLGQAVFAGNHLILNTDAVGGPTVAGARANFSLGKTLPHEVGHCWGLPHTFTENGTCTAENAVSDLNPQKLPNYDFRLFQHPTTGQWTGEKCNRWYDCSLLAGLASSTAWTDGRDVSDAQNQFPWSCMSCTKSGATQDDPFCAPCLQAGQGEVACSFMDYPYDPYLIMFSAVQADIMTETLVDKVQIRDLAKETTYNEDTASTRTLIQTIVDRGYAEGTLLTHSPNGVAATATSAEKEGESTSLTTILAIVGAAILGIVLVAVVVMLIRSARKT